MKKFQVMEDYISVADAATIAGVGKSTVRRAIKKGELFASMVEGPNGEQFSVSRQSFEAWIESRGGAPEVHQVTQETLPGAPMVHQGGPPWDAYIKSQETVQKAIEALERAQAENLKIASQVISLQGKMSSQKMMLTANAESLSKNEERLREAEELAEEKAKKLEELERHNESEKERFEREKEEMLARLKSAESVAARYEKMPSWVKKMFGT